MKPVAILDYVTVSPSGVATSLHADTSEAAYVNKKSLSVRQEIDGNLAWICPLNTQAEALVKSIAAEYPMLDRSVHLSIAAARQLQSKITSRGIGVNIGCSRGATQVWERMHAAYLEDKPLPPYSSPLTTLGNVSSWVAQDLGLESIAISHSVTCSSAAHAVANACAWINSGMSDHFIAGGVEASLTGFTLAQMQALRIYSDASQLLDFPCKPLATERLPGEGMVLGEAAGLFLLSSESRNARAYISGLGFAQEQVGSATAIDEDGVGFERAMSNALADSPGPIDLLIMHAPGTKKGDRSEYRAIERLFKVQNPFLYSNKWLYGHTFAAAAALNLELAIQLLNGSPTQLQFPYESFVAQPYATMPKQISRVMINAAGFGGNVVSIIISKA